jgi:hypothetical protein
VQTIEAIIDAEGRVHPVHPIRGASGHRAVVTVFDETPCETALLSEAALAEDWNRPEEEEAWLYLQPAV